MPSAIQKTGLFQHESQQIIVYNVQDQEMDVQSTKFLQKKRTKKKLCLITSLFILQLFLLLFTFANCKNTCHRSWEFPHPCLSSGSLYCCNMYNPFKQCSDISACRFDNSSCLWLIISSIIVGLVLLGFLIDFFIFTHKMLIKCGQQEQSLIGSLVSNVSGEKYNHQSLITVQ